MIYKTAIFDFDGTIMDTSKGIIQCTNETVQRLGIDIPKDADLKKIIGPPLKVAFMNVLGLDEKRSEEMVEEYRNTYRKSGMLECHVFDGIMEILELFNEKGIDCAIASVKRQTAVMDTLKHFNMTHYFKAICGAASVTTVVDKIDIINNALNILNAQKKSTLMIGDSDYDCQGAKAVDLDFCAVLWGFGYYKADEVSSAKFIIKKPQELKEIFGL